MVTQQTDGPTRFAPRLLSLSQVTAVVDDWLASAGAGSLIRIGDGEGMVLARPAPSDQVLWAHMVKHFGPGITGEDAAALAERLTAAVTNADLVGVRSDLLNVDLPSDLFDHDPESFLAEFRRRVPLRPAERQIGFPGALRLAHTHRFLATHRFSAGQQFCGAWAHFELAVSGALQRWLSLAPRVGLISSRPALQPLLERQFGTTIDFFGVPDMYAEAPVDARQHDYSVYARVCDQLRVQHPGQPYLIGAGVWGKVYCDRIKRLGGIGIDIGAVCDAWVGLATRPLVYQSMFGTNGEVPTTLQLGTVDSSPR